MRKVMTIVLAVLVMLSGCSGSTAAQEPTAAPTAEPTAEPTATPAPTEAPTEAPPMEVDEGLILVTVTLSPELAEGMTQEQLDADRAEMGYISAKLNEDGSATYVMTKKQHREALAKLRETIDAAFAEVSASADYPGIDSVAANEDVSEIIVTMNTKDVGFQETFAAYIFLFYGQIYQTYLGTPDANVRIAYIDSNGEVIHEFNSNELK